MQRLHLLIAASAICIGLAIAAPYGAALVSIFHTAANIIDTTNRSID